MLLHLLLVVDVATIEYNFTSHRALQNRKARNAELLPLGNEHQRIAIHCCIVHIATEGDLIAGLRNPAS